MTNIYYSKHSAFSGRLKEVPSQAPLQQIECWFKCRDYSFTRDLAATAYARELEIRLYIIQNLTMHQFFIGTAYCHEISIWKHSCKTTNPQLRTFDNNAYRPPTSHVSIVKPSELTSRAELAEYFQPQIESLDKYATLDQVLLHSTNTQTTLKRRELLCPTDYDDHQLIVSVNLANSSNKEIMHSIWLQLIAARQELCLPEPKTAKYTRENKVLNQFINKYSLEYLDILIYCAQPEEQRNQLNTHLRPKENHIWDLSDQQVADLLNSDELSGEIVKKWRERTFNQKLLNTDFITKCLLSVRVEETT